MDIESDLKDLQAKLVDDVIKIANILHVTLDYSHESIKGIDQILDVVGKDFRAKKDNQGLEGVALQCAAYIVTVIEAHLEKGEWRRDDKEFGKDTFPYFWRGKVLYPFIWCRKQIEVGEAESVWSKYMTLVLEN